MCGGGLRPWVRLSRDASWVQGANSGAENRFRDVVAGLRGRRVELVCRGMAGEQTLERLAQRLPGTGLTVGGHECPSQYQFLLGEFEYLSHCAKDLLKLESKSRNTLLNLLYPP
jgi:hypothetical protein